MNPLFFLLWLRLRGWARRVGRGMKTVRGALLAALGGFILLSWVFSLIIGQVAPWREQQVTDLEQVRLYGPLILLGYCILAATTTAGERAISFSPAETAILFCGPFTRRQLLLYRITNTLLASLLTACIFTFLVWRYAASWGTAFAGMLLAMTFMQLFPMALVLFGETLGAKAHSRQRKVLLILTIALLLAALLQTGRWGELGDAGTLFQQLAESPILRAVLTPLRWFVELFTAEQFWPDFVVSLALSLLVLTALMVIIMGLDAHYLESAATASEKLYARIQRLRTGGAAAAWTTTAAKPRFSVPDLPRLGGIGPIAWRQTVALCRGLRGLLFFLVIVFVSMGIPLAMKNAEGEDPEELARIIGAIMLSMTLFTLPMTLTFDFRGDVDRIDVLKSLPIAPWRLVVGQLLTPTLVTSLIQVLIVGLLQLAKGGMMELLVAVLCFGTPISFLFFAIENLMFLWFPTRLAGASAADFQLVGRHMVLFLGKMLLIGVTAGISALVGGVVYAITDSIVAAGVACWPVVVGVAAAMVPLIATAFKQFDVARDTPA
jgi:uncharacterized protein (UPF0333 family)